jgi:16S rRNA G1207 methylase RsmC
MKHYFSENNIKEEIFKIKVNLPINNGLPKKTEVYSASNIFSNNEIDLGTKVLIKHIYNSPEKGLFLDVGCGWGAITIFMSILRPKAKIYAIDVNASAIKVCKKNCALLGLNNVKISSAAALKRTIRNKKFDFIMSNPPIRVGRRITIEIIKLWYSYLSVNGKYLNVIQKNLGADSIEKQLNLLNIHTKKISSKKGFRIFQSNL